MTDANAPKASAANNSLWYKDAIIYEVHVRAFADANADGIGDFAGLTQKLDYLQDLGVTAIWLLPFYPSPLKDDGYDIADYYTINPIYGSLRDFKLLLREAHARNLKVITELVVNHTSDQHPWFQRSRRARPGSVWRDFYVWSDTPDKYREARIIFRDFELSNWTWDPVAHAYFWHRFYSHQPDLNYDSPHVHKEIARVLEFWLDLGVDGLRLDAVPYLYEREGTSCENLAETHAYLKTLRKHVDEKYGDRMLLGEANQWPEDAVSYFGSGRGDECHMAFHFPLMPRIFMSVRMEDRVPIVDILDQTPTIPETSQWALFLRNHDELTLEMVTDEERDYMYRVYANDARARLNLGIRRRLAPLLGNDRKRIELLNLLLFSLPGTPVLYYGDEIGMGDNVFLGDRNGVRTPMQWSSDKNAGFSRATPQALYLPIVLDPEYHYEAVNVEAQQRNPNSLLWWTRQILTLRKRYQAFGRGSLRFVQADNRKVLAFLRSYEPERLLVIANLSRYPQPVRLDLSEFQQSVPVELFGGTRFPAITDQQYFLTLSPHAALWFALEPVITSEVSTAIFTRPTFNVDQEWTELLTSNRRDLLESCLAEFLTTSNFLRVSHREVRSVEIRDAFELPASGSSAALLVVTVGFVEGDPQDYYLPIAWANGAAAERIEQVSAGEIICRVRSDSSEIPGLLYLAHRSPEFSRSLLQTVIHRRSVTGLSGELSGFTTHALRGVGFNNDVAAVEPAFGNGQQTNLITIFSEKLFLKFLRRSEPGAHPDLEVSRFLTEQHFPNSAPLAGWIEYHRNDGVAATVGILSRFLPGAHDAWPYTLDTLSRYFDRIRTAAQASPTPPPSEGSLWNLAETEPSESTVALVGTYLELARLLGRRTGELHRALASDPTDRDFAPEPFTPFYQRSLYQSMRNQAVQTIARLRQKLSTIPEDLRADAQKVVDASPEILKRFRSVYQVPLTAQRIRCHGDLHLGQLLYTGKDFIFVDFEGQPSRPLGERRIKRSPLFDVASMIRSLDYVAYAALLKQIELGTLQSQQLDSLEPWIRFWSRQVSAVFLRAYLEAVKGSLLVPAAKEPFSVLLGAYLVEKAIAEIGYELDHRLDWLKIPIRGLLQLLSSSS